MYLKQTCCIKHQWSSSTFFILFLYIGGPLYQYNADISVLIFSTKTYLRCIHKTIVLVNNYQKFSNTKY